MRYLCVVATAAVLALVSAPASGARPAAAPEQVAKPLVIRFFRLIRDRDVVS